MKITPIEITIGQLLSGFVDNGVEGVKSYNGKLDVRPPYQREFVYGEKQQKAVIETVLQDYPLNVMYWVKVDGHDAYEVLDGQQRTISLARFAVEKVGFYITDPIGGKSKNFDSLSPERQKKFMDYKLTVYVCEGSHDKKLAWFQTINIAGAVLTPQELRNAVYSGSWTAAAKVLFSGGNPPMAAKAKGLFGTNIKPLRQELLELAIEWACPGKSSKSEEIEIYMASHKTDKDANALKSHFMNVVNWANAMFPPENDKIGLRKSVDWGDLYRRHGTQPLKDVDKLEVEIVRLLKDDEVQKKAGIYAYLLDLDERHLNLRSFPEDMKIAQYTAQNGKCLKCGGAKPYQEMHGDHKVAWSKGGRTEPSNLEMLCQPCNSSKGNKGPMAAPSFSPTSATSPHTHSSTPPTTTDGSPIP